MPTDACNQPPVTPIGVLCTGCGSSWDSARLAEEKRKNPELLSCCPERKTIPVYAGPTPTQQQLEHGLRAAMRAANLALFVIRKAGVMPNDSWKNGFERDMATAREALGQPYTTNEKTENAQ